MSNRKRIVIAAVVLFPVAGAWHAWDVRRRDQPDFLWSLVQTAAQNDDRAEVKQHLDNLLRRYPDHVDGHLALSQYFLDEAQRRSRPATYQGQPQALAHLQEAAKLRPERPDLQEKCLRALIEAGRMHDASALAPKVLAHDKTDADALYCLSWRATNDYREVEDALNTMTDRFPDSGYRARTMQAALYKSTKNEPLLQETLAGAIETALTTPAENLFALPVAEQRALFELFQWAVYESPQRAVADRRLAAALTVIERLGPLAAPPSALTLGDLAERATSLVMTYEVRYQVDQQAFEADDVFRTFVEQAEQLRVQAVGQGTAMPGAYLQSAMLASRRGDYGTAVQWAIAGAERAESAPSGFERERSDLRLFAARCLVKVGRYAEAKPQLDLLLTDPYNAGWAHFLSGRMAVEEGRLNVALQQFIAARAKSGDLLQVRWEIAQAYLGLQRWQEAMPLLASLQAELRQPRSSDVDWLRNQLESESSIRWAQLQACLGLRKWREASVLLESLVGSGYEDRAAILTLVSLRYAGPSPEARAVKEVVERRFPQQEKRAAELATQLQDASHSTDDVLRLDRELTAASQDSTSILSTTDFV